jgi:hypothetical protein
MIKSLVNGHWLVLSLLLGVSSGTRRQGRLLTRVASACLHVVLWEQIAPPRSICSQKPFSKSRGVGGDGRGDFPMYHHDHKLFRTYIYNTLNCMRNSSLYFRKGFLYAVLPPNPKLSSNILNKIIRRVPTLRRNYYAAFAKEKVQKDPKLRESKWTAAKKSV